MASKVVDNCNVLIALPCDYNTILMEDPNNKISTLFQLLLFFFIQHFKPPTNFWESACYDRGPDGSILAIRLVLSHLIHVY